MRLAFGHDVRRALHIRGGLSSNSGLHEHRFGGYHYKSKTHAALIFDQWVPYDCMLRPPRLGVCDRIVMHGRLCAVDACDKPPILVYFHVSALTGNAITD
jgi:hypothetical protein